MKDADKLDLVRLLNMYRQELRLELDTSDYSQIAIVYDMHNQIEYIHNLIVHLPADDGQISTKDTLVKALREVRYLVINNRGAVDIIGVVHICNAALATLEDS